MRNFTFAMVTSILFFVLTLTSTANETVLAKTMWGKIELKEGMIGKVKILKDTYQYSISKKKLKKGNLLKKGKEFGVYSYSKSYGGIYKIGSNKFIKKSPSIKYYEASKNLIEDDPSGQLVNIPDKNLVQAIRKELNLLTKDITIEDMKTLKNLSLDENSIKDITGLEYATNLTSLYIGNSEISDISVLSHLTKLNELTLYNNQISDISVLSHLTKLATLNLSENKISDISALSNLRNLKQLYLYDNPLDETAISIIEKLKAKGVDVSSDSIEIIKMNNEVEKAADKIISEVIYADMSDFEKVKAIHDYVVFNTEYDYENYINNTIPDSSYNIDGVLINRVAVCQGYAEAMVYLLDKIGIESFLVSGIAGGGGHAWNKVKIDGIWYNLDATWDDPVFSNENIKSFVGYNYFLIPDSELANDHSWDDSELPDATDTTYLFMSDMWDTYVHDGYYYYSSNSDDINLYKIRMDGTDKKKIADIRVNELVVYGDWIYFSNYSDGGYLYKIKTDGTEITKLTNFYVQNLELNQTILRYSDENGSESYSLDIL